MRVSAIEIGTNSTKFIIAEPTEKDCLRVIHKKSFNNRLSAGMYPDKCLNPQSIAREIEIIKECMNETENRGGELLSIFSTSVLRDAKNKMDFLNAVKSEVGMDVNIISGECEAFLMHKACSEIMKSKGRIFSSMDIGGGSTEISVGDCQIIDKQISLDMGAVRLSEMFIRNDPPLNSEIERIYAYVDDMLKEAGPFNMHGIALVGTVGTIKSIGTIFLSADYKEEGKVHGLVLTKKDVERIFEFISRLCIDEKRILTGLNPKRADVIVTGTAILVAILRRYHLKEIMISSQGVLEGFVMDYFSRRKDDMYVTH